MYISVFSKLWLEINKTGRLYDRWGDPLSLLRVLPPGDVFRSLYGFIYDTSPESLSDPPVQDTDDQLVG